MADDIVNLARAEVHRWYSIFYAWSRGLVGARDQAARHIYETLAPDFRVVLTDGRALNRESYWERLAGLYATRKDSPPSEITNLSLVRVSDEHVLVVFDLRKSGVPGKKVDTALLRRDPQASGGMCWVHVHESEHTGETS